LTNRNTFSFGYTDKQTILLGLPGAGITFVTIYLVGFVSGRYNARNLNVVATLVPGIIGGALMAYLPADDKAGLLIGNYLTYVTGPSLVLIYSIISANVSGHTKKITMNALVLIAFCLGNILGPLTFRDQDAPQYIPAKITIFVTNAISIALTFVLLGYYMWENKRRDKLMMGVPHTENVEFMDLTDKENMEFRVSDRFLAEVLEDVSLLTLRAVLLLRCWHLGAGETSCMLYQWRRLLPTSEGHTPNV
jgi:MFS family permease